MAPAQKAFPFDPSCPKPHDYGKSLNSEPARVQRERSFLLFGEEADAGPRALGSEVRRGNLGDEAWKEGKAVQLGGGVDNRADLLRLPAVAGQEIRALLWREL